MARWTALQSTNCLARPSLALHYLGWHVGWRYPATVLCPKEVSLAGGTARHGE